MITSNFLRGWSCLLSDNHHCPSTHLEPTLINNANEQESEQIITITFDKHKHNTSRNNIYSNTSIQLDQIWCHKRTSHCSSRGYFHLPVFLRFLQTMVLSSEKEYGPDQQESHWGRTTIYARYVTVDSNGIPVLSRAHQSLMTSDSTECNFTVRGFVLSTSGSDLFVDNPSRQAMISTLLQLSK